MKNDMESTESNKRSSGRAGTKVRAAAERASTKVKQAGRTVKEGGRRAKSRAKATTRSRNA